MTSTYEDLLVDLAQTRPELVVMTAENRAAIRGIPARLPDRFVDVGICEQTMVGIAAGLALRGRQPICHALATFLTLRAFEFIRDDVGIPHLPVVLVGGVPGFLSDANGPTHQAIEDIALMRGIPGMQVVCPADRDELLAAIPHILDSRAPTYVRYFAGDPATAHHEPYRLGKAETFGDGDVAIVTHGFLLAQALTAQTVLADKGIAARVVNLRTLAPIDEDALVALAGSRLIVTVEDHFETNGLYAILAALYLKRGLSARALPVALSQRWFTPALLADVLTVEGFTGERIAGRILEALS
jgi:transketolase